VTKQNDKGLFGPFIYLWLALSMLLNIASIASIVDGFVHWAYFFKDFLDTYRAWIREPISWAVHLVWPSWWPKIPSWVFDLLVIWAAFVFGFNFGVIRNSGRSVFSVMCDSVRDFCYGLIFIAAWPLLAPLHFRCVCHGHRLSLPKLANSAHWQLKPFQHTEGVGGEKCATSVDCLINPSFYFWPRCSVSQ